MTPRRGRDKVTWADLRITSNLANSQFNSVSPKPQVEASLETETLLNLLWRVHMLCLVMSSCDRFGENWDSTAVMETRVKTCCMSWQGRKVAWSWLCCSLNKWYVPDNADASDMYFCMAGQGFCHLKRGCRDGYETGWLNWTAWENPG